MDTTSDRRAASQTGPPHGDPRRDAAETGGTESNGQVDAQLFLALSDRLKEAFAKLGSADLAPAQRDRWQNRLLAITNAAKHDLSRAAQRLDRYEDDFRRETGA